MNITALLISDQDNVVTVIKELKAGEEVIYLAGEEYVTMTTTGVPAYHKVACRDIKAGEDVIKYGQVMAVATCDIKTGEHVHTHNVKSKVQ